MTKLLDWIVGRLALWLTASGVLTLTAVVWILNAQAGVDWGDAPAWAAFLISLGSGAIALIALKYAKTSAQASEISAKAAVRQAAAAERQVELAEAAAEAADSGVSPPGKRPDSWTEGGSMEAAVLPYVAWWVEQRSKNTYVLRNIGTDIAREVEIDQSRIQCVVRSATKVDEIPPDASTEIFLIPMYGGPKPNELWVRWEGHPEWKAVPLP
ncbi:hypothetical protein [Micromonospora sp. NPDC048169]|uniref:hypothetical protein n=1 Tax=unclassified Micromonospora TaxID=2617518 RepID=UPI0034104723